MSEVLACARHTETEVLLQVVAGEHGDLTAVQVEADDEGPFIGLLPADAIDESVAGTWRHFKGGMYEFITRVGSSEGDLVLYRDGDGGCWLRPLSMVGDAVVRDGVSRPRFVQVTAGL